MLYLSTLANYLKIFSSGKYDARSKRDSSSSRQRSFYASERLWEDFQTTVEKCANNYNRHPVAIIIRFFFLNVSMLYQRNYFSPMVLMIRQFNSASIPFLKVVFKSLKLLFICISKLMREYFEVFKLVNSIAKFIYE